MSPLHPVQTLLTMPDMHVELRDDGRNRTRDVFLILHLHLILDHGTPTVWTSRWQRRLLDVIDMVRWWTMRGPMPFLPAGFLRLRFGSTARERRGLPPARPLRRFELRFQVVHDGFQLRQALFQRGILGVQSLVFGDQFFDRHTFSLTSLDSDFNSTCWQLTARPTFTQNSATMR
jgi:hypothetical protein